jgi:hypothetical protein
MLNRLVIAASVLALAALACSPNIDLPDINVNVPRVETGPTQTLALDVPAPDAEEADVTLSMGAGELNVTGGAEGLVGGSIDYNVADWAPTVTTDGAEVTIKQPDIQDNLGIPGGDSEIVNDWNVTLGEMPMNLTVNAGAYEGELALGGVPLRSLDINDGASQSEVSFDSLNPETMDTFSYNTGASSVTMTGLANANFAELEFSFGAGDYDLDFSGDLQRDATVKLKGGLSSVRLEFPTGTNVRVEVTGGLNSVDTTGDWTQDGDTYTLAGEGPTITVELDMGAGEVDLVADE